jgi:hypothetical protein
MKRSAFTTVTTLAACSAAFIGVVALAAPAQAEGDTDAFLSALDNADLGVSDPANAVAVGQSVCPMLSEPGQNAADAAAKVSDAMGMPLGPATMFTGIAISMFCPSVVSSIGNGTAADALPLLGF